jgi:hypothetical protein
MERVVSGSELEVFGRNQGGKSRVCLERKVELSTKFYSLFVLRE